jgi:hypothetical protein
MNGAREPDPYSYESLIDSVSRLFWQSPEVAALLNAIPTPFGLGYAVHRM